MFWCTKVAVAVWLSHLPLVVLCIVPSVVIEHSECWCPAFGPADRLQVLRRLAHTELGVHLALSPLLLVLVFGVPDEMPQGHAAWVVADEVGGVVGGGWPVAIGEVGEEGMHFNWALCLCLLAFLLVGDRQVFALFGIDVGAAHSSSAPCLLLAFDFARGDANAVFFEVFFAKEVVFRVKERLS